MKKYETHLQGDLDELLRWLHEEFVDPAKEQSSEYHVDHFRCVMRVYEKYSFWSKGNISLTILLVESKNDLFVSVISSGGNVIFDRLRRKLLAQAVKVIEAYKRYG